MSTLFRGLAAAAACAATVALGQAKSNPVDAIPTPDIPYTKFVLPNGLTLLVHEDHKAPIVAVNTWYHVGSKDEKVGKTGFAHLFEHLMFAGSENFKTGTYIEAMQRAGATALNGTTWFDRTNYFQNVPVATLDYVLFAESDRMGHLLGSIDQKTLDLQRGVVQNEKRQRENQPYGIAEEILLANAFPKGHPYSWSTIGSMADLDAASLTDVKDWFKSNYGPNNTVLVIAGDITPEVARQKVEKFYGGIPPGPPLVRQGAWIAKRTGTHRASAQDRVPQTKIFREWNVPPFGTREEAMLDLVAHVMGGGKTSRLSRRLVYKDQVATAANAENEAHQIAGMFQYEITVKPGADAAKVDAVVMEETARFLKEGPTEEELRLAKTRILSGLIRPLERIGGFGGKSEILARCVTYTGKPECYKDYANWVRTATAADVKRAANEWLADGDFVLTISPYPTQLKAGQDVDRKVVPAAGEAGKLNLPPMQKATLSNGLKIVLAERHNAPIVNFTMMVDSGYAADKPDMPGVASLALRMIEEGTKTRDAQRIGRELESLGATFNAAANLDGATANFNILKATMPQGLELFADLVLNPAYPQADFERLQRDRLAAIQREKATPQSMALRVVGGVLYGQGHPYATPLTGTGTEAAVQKMTRNDLVAFHQAWFRPNNATLLVVGDTTMAEVKPRLEALFGKWAQGPVPSKVLPVASPATKPTVYLIDRPGSLQSIIVGAELATPTSDPNEISVKVVNEVFGAGFSSRINMNLREDKHWTYGAVALMPDAKGQRPFFSIAPVQTDKTQDALKELASEYDRITGKAPITAAELAAAKARMTLRVPGNFETALALSGAYRTILQYGLPEDYWNTYTQRVEGVSVDAANAFAPKLVQPSAVSWIVVGDMSKVEAGIRALNLGEVKKIDVDGKPL